MKVPDGCDENELRRGGKHTSTYGSKTWFPACGVLDVEMHAAADIRGDEAIISLLLAGSKVRKAANDRRCIMMEVVAVGNGLA